MIGYSVNSVHQPNNITSYSSDNSLHATRIKKKCMYSSWRMYAELVYSKFTFKCIRRLTKRNAKQITRMTTQVTVIEIFEYDGRSINISSTDLWSCDLHFIGNKQHIILSSEYMILVNINDNNDYLLLLRLSFSKSNLSLFVSQ